MEGTSEGRRIKWDVAITSYPGYSRAKSDQEDGTEQVMRPVSGISWCQGNSSGFVLCPGSYGCLHTKVSLFNINWWSEKQSHGNFSCLKKALIGFLKLFSYQNKAFPMEKLETSFSKSSFSYSMVFPDLQLC